MLLVGSKKDSSKYMSFYTALSFILLSQYKKEILFNNCVLVAEKNNNPTRIINAYIVYNLDDWLKNPT